jgi:hypothetical protein
MSSSTEPELITITATRLAELEAADAKLKQIRAKELERFKRLGGKRDCEKHRQQVLQHYHEHKDEINAKRNERRREARRLKKDAEEAAAAKTPGDGNSTPVENPCEKPEH